MNTPLSDRGSSNKESEMYVLNKYLPHQHKGVNQRSKDVREAQQQRPESPTVTLTWHACKYKVHKLAHRYILKMDDPKWHIIYTLHIL